MKSIFTRKIDFYVSKKILPLCGIKVKNGRQKNSNKKIPISIYGIWTAYAAVETLLLPPSASVVIAVWMALLLMVMMPMMMCKHLHDVRYFFYMGSDKIAVKKYPHCLSNEILFILKKGIFGKKLQFTTKWGHDYVGY